MGMYWNNVSSSNNPPRPNTFLSMHVCRSQVDWVSIESISMWFWFCNKEPPRLKDCSVRSHLVGKRRLLWFLLVMSEFVALYLHLLWTVFSVPSSPSNPLNCQNIMKLWWFSRGFQSWWKILVKGTQVCVCLGQFLLKEKKIQVRH